MDDDMDDDTDEAPTNPDDERPVDEDRASDEHHPLDAERPVDDPTVSSDEYDVESPGRSLLEDDDSIVEPNEPG